QLGHVDVDRPRVGRRPVARRARQIVRLLQRAPGGREPDRHREVGVQLLPHGAHLMIGPSLILAAWKKRRFDPAKKKRLMGALRVTAYAMAVCAGLGVYSYRSAKADIAKSSIVIGRDLAKMSDLIEETTQVKMNGETVFIAT